MPWTWRYESAGGDVLDPPEAPRVESFATQAEAEDWIGLNWRELRSAGIDAVSLLDGDRVVYGPMSLHPAS